MITIDYRSRKPIYEQIIDNIKEQVTTGILKPDEQISSIRQLTAKLGINPNTVHKAYAELERQGIIYNLTGRGTFVASDTEKIVNSRKEEILSQIKVSLETARKYNIEKNIIETMLDEVYLIN